MKNEFERYDPHRLKPVRALGESKGQSLTLDNNLEKYGNIIMKKLYLILMVFMLSCASTKVYSKPYSLHASGYGPVMIGMTTKEASRVIGVNLHQEISADQDAYYCHYVAPGKGEPVAFMVQKDIITRIDAYASSISTDKGITVGSDEKAVFEKYEKVMEKPHPYLDDAGKYLIINTKENHQIIFETDNGKITRFRTGRIPAVEYIEGCL